VAHPTCQFGPTASQSPGIAGWLAPLAGGTGVICIAAQSGLPVGRLAGDEDGIEGLPDVLAEPGVALDGRPLEDTDVGVAPPPDRPLPTAAACGARCGAGW
jgi:hypothetical protein